MCNGGCIWMHHHKLQIAMLMIFVPACSRGGSMPLPPAARHPSSNGTHTGQQPTPLSHSAQKHRYKASNLTSQSSPIRDTTRTSFPSNRRHSDKSLNLPGGPPTKWDPPGSGANYRIWYICSGPRPAENGPNQACKGFSWLIICVVPFLPWMETPDWLSLYPCLEE